MEDNNKKKVKRQILYAIFGVLLLIVVVVGVTYAYYMARRTAVFNGTTEGYVKLEVNLISTNADKNLLPIDDSTENLTKKARGWRNGYYNSWFLSTYACIDKSGYSACQVYEVQLFNHTDHALTVNIGVTSLTGASAPNIDVVKMTGDCTDDCSVTDNTSIKGNASGIASNLTLQKGEASPSYYILVFVRNNPNGQSDTGTFSGIVTAATVSGPALPNDGVVTAEF